MSRRTGRLVSATLAAGLVLSVGGAALAAPATRALKQFRVPTANSQPRAITDGSDGNRWFTEGTEFTGQPPKIARITPSGAITEFLVDDVNDFTDGCTECIISDITQGPGGILYITSNDPFLLRFNLNTQNFLAPVQMPNTSANGNTLAASASAVWITDFNNDVVWRYDIGSGQFTSSAASDPGDVTVDTAGNAWFTQPGDVNAPGTSNIGRIDAVTGAVSFTATTDGATTVAPNGIAVTPGPNPQVWFTSRFNHAVGHLNPSAGTVGLFPVDNTGPRGIASAADGTIWFTQELKGNVATINSAGVITEGKAVKGSGPFEVVVDPNGDPWYTMMDANKIAALVTK